MQCNEVIISCPLGVKSQEFPSLEPVQPATPQREQDLPPGITLTDFPGTPAEKQEAIRIFTSYADVFARDGVDLGRTTTIQHSISTTDDIPVAQRHRQIPPNHLMEVKQHLQGLLDKGVTAPSQGSFPSPIVIIRKKNGALHMCMDYCLLNAKARRDAYPLPRIDESLDVQEEPSTI